MGYSIIVPTLNRAADLQRALRSLAISVRSSKSIEAEIMVVDNGSVDHTKSTCVEIRDAFPDCTWRYFHEPVPGLLSGRHRGALEAKGEILIFVDDDMEAAPGWLQGIADAFADSEVKIVGGRNLPKYETEPPVWLTSFWKATPYGGSSCDWLSLLDLGGEPIDIHPNYVWGLNFAIRRSVLIELGGFHPDCIPPSLQQFQGDGETGLTRKAHERGYRARYCPAATVFHSVPGSRMTREYFERRGFYQGVCDSYTHVREAGCVQSFPGQPHRAAASPHSLAGLLRETVKRANGFSLFQYMKQLIRQPAKASLHRAKGAAIRYRARQAYKEGYKFHQNAVRTNPNLMNWVLRKDYWDYRLPNSAEGPI